MATLRKSSTPLSVSHPYLLKEWDYGKNMAISPDDISYGSEIKVWWICSEGHSWEASVNSRTNMNCSCPYCSGRRVISGVNDLLTLNPNVAKNWDYIKNAPLLPSEVSCKSNKKVWWICENNHSYEAVIGNRTRDNNGCPYCSGQRTLSGYNDFKTWCINNGRQDLIEKWDYDKNTLAPECISPKNSKKVWWKCALGHEWYSTIGSRTSSRPSGCPYCSNPPKRILIGFNDFESWCINNGKQQLLDEWNMTRNTAFSPKEITYGSGKQAWWRCKRGHEWRTPVSARTQGRGCPVCSRTQTSFPEQAIAYYLSKSFNILQRYRIMNYEMDVYLEDYRIGIEYDGMYFHRDNVAYREKEKDEILKDQGVRIIRIKESKDKTAVEDDVVYYVVKKTNYLDDGFNNMMQSLLSLIENVTGIQINKDIDIRRDELSIREHYAAMLKACSVAAVYPELVSEWDIEKNNGMTPDNFTANANIKVWWKCSKGHSWQALISSRGRKLGCPYCAGQKTLKGKNDLESWCNRNSPDLLEEWNYDMNNILPSEISKTSNKKAWWICSKGHVWEAVIANRVHGTRCPICYTGNKVRRNIVSLYQWCQSNDRADLLSEWEIEKNTPLTPHMVTKGSHKKVWWKCANGHEWEAEIKSRTYNHGCPYCSGTYKKAQSGVNDLVTWCKENNKTYILDEWDYNANDDLVPEMFTFGSHKRINWICKYGHKWNSVIKERTKYRGNMCPYCNKDVFSNKE